MKMLEGMHGRGHIVIMDNFFTSVKLLHDLYDMETYGTGTIPAGRKGLPSNLCKKAYFKGGKQGNLAFRTHKGRHMIL